MKTALRLADVSTPTALIDEAQMMHNVARMQQRMKALGVRLRPHVKTSKCAEVARRQLTDSHAITVSTLKEAEEFFSAGFSDVFYAVCIAPDKLDRVIALCRRGCALTILVDAPATAQAIIAKGRAEQHAFDVMVEVDTDSHRSGVKPDADALIEIGRILHCGGAVLEGVMTHAGSSYELDTPSALVQLAEQERSGCVRAAGRLRSAGLPCPEVSVGSTPTALSAKDLTGVTEVRAGVYVFFDLVMVNVGICTLQDVALSVLTTVIGHQVEKGWAIVDAGWMAMSRDRGTRLQKRDYGFGAVCDLDGNPIDGFVLSAANQEHGILTRANGTVDHEIAERFPIGARLRILPNHACATGAQFPHYHTVGAGGAVDVWSRFHGW